MAPHLKHSQFVIKVRRFRRKRRLARKRKRANNRRKMKRAIQRQYELCLTPTPCTTSQVNMFQSAVGKWVSAKCGDVQEIGQCIAVDPQSKNVLLIQESQEGWEPCLIVGHYLKELDVLGESRLPQILSSARGHAILCLIDHRIVPPPSEEQTRARRDFILEWFKNGNFPLVNINNVLAFENILEIHPPYTKRSVHSRDPVVFKRAYYLLEVIEKKLKSSCCNTERLSS